MKYCTEYQYKCRMCGEIFSPENSFGYNWVLAMGEVISAEDRHNAEHNKPGLITTHASCGSKKNRKNQFGIADFIGAKKVLFCKSQKNK